MTRNDPVRIGVMFSQTGWTAVTERTMLEATSFAIEEINRAGGINGRTLTPVYRDPAGEPAAYQDMAYELLSECGVKIILGGYTSSQRKAVLSTLDREAGLLCYPAQYEGFEYSDNIIYFGAVPNQNSLFLAQYLIENHTPCIYIVGSDYVWPRESGRIMADLIRSGGGEILGETYLGSNARPEEFDALMRDIVRCRPAVIFNNFVGQSNLDFYAAYAACKPDAVVASLTTSEADLHHIDAGIAEGHITAATYFASQNNQTNLAVLDRYKASRGCLPLANMCWEAAYSQTHMIALAMSNGNAENVNSIREGMLKQSYDAPQGRISIDPANMHCLSWPKIGVARRDGQFDVIAETTGPVRPDPYRTTYAIPCAGQPTPAVSRRTGTVP